MENKIEFIFDKRKTLKFKEQTVCVDGSMDVKLELSHWPNNNTPQELKGDVAVEIVFNLLESPDKEKYLQDIKFITNNHFDADGLLAAYSIIFPEEAKKFRNAFIATAIASDFNEFTSEDSIKAAIVIDSLLDITLNPLIKNDIGDKDFAEKIQIAYMKGFELVPKIFSYIDAYESIWREEISNLEKSFNSFENRTSQLSEYPDLNLTVYESSFFLSPFAKFSRTKNDIILNCVKEKNGWFYLLEYKPYTWFETKTRKKFVRKSFAKLAEELNRKYNFVNPKFKEIGLNPEEDWDYRLAFAYDDLSLAICPISLDKIEEDILNFIEK